MAGSLMDLETAGASFASEAVSSRLLRSADDALSLVLENVRLKSHFFGRAEFAAPWGLRVGTRLSAIFHVQLAGSSALEVEGVPSLHLETGDIALLPHGTAHILRSEPQTPCVTIESLIEASDGSGVLRFGDGSRDHRFLCGGFELADGAANPLMRALPPLIVIRASERGSWLETTLAFITQEAASADPGANAVIRRLADVLLIQCLRHHLKSKRECEPGCWIRGLGDPGISRSLLEIHRAPDLRWSVEELARVAGMSRSAFAAKFTELVGETPAAYLTAWRMNRGAELLRGSKLRLAEIAERSGYESEASFSRVFRKHYGVSPGRFRRA
jgi:AraC-like DNA-binding protein